MKMVARATPAGLAAVCLVTLAGCGSASATGGPPAHSPSAGAAAQPCAKSSGFELSLASDRGGQPGPVAAAVWFAQHGGVADVPVHGWRVTSRSAHAAVVTSGSLVLHAQQGSDGTWQIDSGYRCS
jgi:hypothetical protein